MFVRRLLQSATVALGVLTQAAQAESISYAVQTALTQHPEIKAADANFRALVYELMQQQEGYVPTFSLFGNVGAEYVDNPTSLSPADNARTKATYQLGVVAELTIVDGFRRANQAYAGAARVDQSVFQLLDASEAMALSVAEAYINVARQYGLLRVARDSLERYQQIEVQARDLADGGSMPVSDLLQIESRVVAAQAAIFETERALMEARVRFKGLVGRHPNGYLALPTPARVPSSMEELVAASVKNNFRMEQARREIDIRDYEYGAADARYQPQVSLNAGVSTAQNQGGVTSEEHNAFVGLSLNWQLSQGQRDDLRNAFSQRTNQARYQLHAVARDVEVLASLAWVTYRKTLERRDTLREQIGVSEALVDVYEQEFQLATRSLLDLLIVEASLNAARVEKINAEAILSFASYRALAAQSRLASHFGVKQSRRVFGDVFTAEAQPDPRALIKNGPLLLDQ